MALSDPFILLMESIKPHGITPQQAALVLEGERHVKGPKALETLHKIGFLCKEGQHYYLTPLGHEAIAAHKLPCSERIVLAGLYRQALEEVACPQDFLYTHTMALHNLCIRGLAIAHQWGPEITLEGVKVWELIRLGSKGDTGKRGSLDWRPLLSEKLGLVLHVDFPRG